MKICCYFAVAKHRFILNLFKLRNRGKDRENFSQNNIKIIILLLRYCYRKNQKCRKIRICFFFSISIFKFSIKFISMQIKAKERENVK